MADGAGSGPLTQRKFAAVRFLALQRLMRNASAPRRLDLDRACHPIERPPSMTIRAPVLVLSRVKRMIGPIGHLASL